MDPRHHYTNQTLIGNWYEDRLDDSKVGHDPRKLRQGTVGETPIKMQRPVEGFYRTQCMQTYQRPKRLRPQSNVSIVNMNTVRNTLLQDRSVPPRVYNAPLPRHGPDRDIQEMYTTYHSTHGGKHAEDPKMRYECPPVYNDTAGMSSKEISLVGSRGLKGASATGERLKHGPEWDPKELTFVQRSWNYNRDNSAYYTNDYIRPEHTRGVHLKGLGEGTEYRTGVKFTLNNDTIKHSTGIWADV
mmetsp:Transcript_14628/g.20767  ORF Transcript_14628/g.20767 Transcript_14628/m.20767 type:complete len:243 (+) Transcript_14628:43-771(+)|eukprot:CAMPEP_0175093374 /NCGR_PEP_ID=MMETSP0086_2-20121207/2978_1 /TAXON_ID=136419 /ORGANISM="Unknown Unknown, Strain D1" /LENGTH=242 /DNA_ID=CAMNT_0016366331 /DNA_START=40 /DNA_END=768 /DNA_ORIENTATION=+